MYTINKGKTFSLAEYVLQRNEEMLMKKNRTSLYLFILSVLLAGGIGYYWHNAGLDDITVLNAATAVFIAGLPLPYMLGKLLPYTRGARQAQKNDAPSRSRGHVMPHGVPQLSPAIMVAGFPAMECAAPSPANAER